MASKKQPELPHTRRDDEPPAPKPIKALDDACDQLEKLKGKVTRAGQEVVAQKHTIDELLRKHAVTSYTYETAAGVEKKVFIKSSIATAKVKKAKLDDDAGEDGADE